MEIWTFEISEGTTVHMPRLLAVTFQSTLPSGIHRFALIQLLLLFLQLPLKRRLAYRMHKIMKSKRSERRCTPAAHTTTIARKLKIRDNHTLNTTLQLLMNGSNRCSINGNMTKHVT